MDSLFEALYTYAAKQRIDIYLQRDRQEWEDNEWMVRCAMDELKTQGLDDAAQRIQDGFSTLGFLDRRSAFRAGLAIGLELNRL